MKKKEYDEKHQKVIKLANAYREEHLKSPSIERWMESADPMEKSQYYGMVHSMYTAAAELWWINQNDLIWIPDPDPQKNIHMQKGNVIRMLKYFAQHYHKIETESIGTIGLIERCAVINSAINEDDPNDRVWTEYRRLIAPKEKHDPDKSKLYEYIRQEYHRDFDYLWDRIIQIMGFSADDQTLARIACAMYESNMTIYHEYQRKWSKWYRAFCNALAIDCVEVYQDHRPQLKEENAYFKIVNAIHSYLPKGYADDHVAKLKKNIEAILSNPNLSDSQKLDEWNIYLRSEPDYRIGMQSKQKSALSSALSDPEQSDGFGDKKDVQSADRRHQARIGKGYSESDDTWEKIENGKI